MQCQNDDMPFDDTPIDDTSLVGEWLLYESLGYSADFNESKTRLTLSPSYPAICIEGCLYRFNKE